jgi:hypothetical protein
MTKTTARRGNRRLLVAWLGCGEPVRFLLTSKSARTLPHHFEQRPRSDPDWRRDGFQTGAMASRGDREGSR